MTFMPTDRRLPGVAVVTIAAGRHAHLAGQQAGLVGADRTALPEHVVVVSMSDDTLAEVVATGPASAHGWAGRVGEARPDIHLVSVPLPQGELAGELPLAAARNAGVEAAASLGAHTVVLLDVDCIPGRDLVRRYAEVLAADELVVACGPVAYLPDRAELAAAGERLGPDGDYPLRRLADLAEPHPARPAPAPGEVVEADDVRLFWSLSFATRVTTWHRLGGFDEAYVGYGGEDTDFGQRIAERARMVWVGGAEAYHQHHPVSRPPVQHLEAIVRNANLFHDRWGWFCMEGWLAEFDRLGLAHHDEAADRWVVTPQT